MTRRERGTWTIDQHGGRWAAERANVIGEARAETAADAPHRRHPRGQ